MSDDNTTRRWFLRSAGTVSAATMAGLAGCSGNGGDGEGEETEPETETDSGMETDPGEETDTGDSEWPTQRMRLIIPFSEGGGTDTWHRQFIPVVSEELGQPIQIDNIPGAASLRGAAEMVRADPDGYTWGAFNPPSTPTSYMLNPQDWELTSLKGVCRYARQAYVFYVNPDQGFEDFSAVLEAYQNGDLQNFGGQQVGGIVWVMAHLLRNLDDYQMAWENYVGYDGGGPLVQAVASGEVPCGVTTPASGVGAIESGDVDVVAVMASDGDPQVPDVPSVTDLGFENIDYIGQLQRCEWAPEGTPDRYIDQWSSAVETALQSDRMQQWLEETGNRTDFAGPEAANNALQNAFETIPEQVDLESLREQV